MGKLDNSVCLRFTARRRSGDVYADVGFNSDNIGRIMAVPMAKKMAALWLDRNHDRELESVFGANTGCFDR